MPLGRGLESLLIQNREPGGNRVPNGNGHNGNGHRDDLLEVDPAQVSPPRWQPRKRFADAPLAELEASVRENGILEPVLVRRKGKGYELIAGERRLRVAQRLKIPRIPARVLDVDDPKACEIALIENVQREDLTAVEKAEAFRELAKTYGLTQEEIAKRVGLERSTVANFLRLLDLPAEVLSMLSEGRLTMGHAKALLSLPDAAAMLSAARRIADEKVSVRDAETIVANGNGKHRLPPPRARRPADPVIADYESRLQRALGAKVRIRAKNGRGDIKIHFGSDAEFVRILGLLERRFSV